MAFRIGIDVGGTKIYAALAEGKRIHQSFETFTPKTLHEFSKSICEIIEMFQQVTSSHIANVGIGIPGAVHHDEQCWVPNLPYLTGINLRKLLEESCGKSIRIANDGQLALLGEVWHGAAQGLRDVVLVSIGTGIGGAIMTDGKILTGVHGTAGSMGWLAVGRNHEEYVHYESIASGTALNQLARTENFTSYELLQAVKIGETKAARLFEEWIARVGMGVASVASVFDAEAILITGGLSREEQLIVPLLQKAVKRFASPFTQDTPIMSGKLKDKAALYGALRMAEIGNLVRKRGKYDNTLT